MAGVDSGPHTVPALTTVAGALFSPWRVCTVGAAGVDTEFDGTVKPLAGASIGYLPQA